MRTITVLICTICSGSDAKLDAWCKVRNLSLDMFWRSLQCKLSLLWCDYVLEWVLFLRRSLRICMDLYANTALLIVVAKLISGSILRKKVVICGNFAPECTSCLGLFGMLWHQVDTVHFVNKRSRPSRGSSIQSLCKDIPAECMSPCKVQKTLTDHCFMAMKVDSLGREKVTQVPGHFLNGTHACHEFLTWCRKWH